MENILAGSCFGLGLIIGSFLNVVIYRLHTGRTLDGRSHCLSCGKTLRWYHLIPVLSYVILRGRCGFCGARIAPRYFMVEVLTGGLFLLAYLAVADLIFLPLYFALIAIAVVIIVYDMVHTIIPDECIIALCAVALLFGVGMLLIDRDIVHFVARIAGAGAGFSFFGFLWYVSGGKWIGFGDAKLAVPLGFILAWPSVVPAIILSFWIGAAVSIVLLIVSRLVERGQVYLRFLPRSLTIKSEVPFAPFLIAGFLSVHFFHTDVFTLVGYLIF